MYQESYDIVCFNNSICYPVHCDLKVYEEFKDTKEVFRNRKLKDRKYNGQRKKDKNTKHYTEN